MAETTKKCPECAEEIPAEEVTCRFCGAQFAVTVRGYCPNCHDEVELSKDGKCSRCGGDVIDRHVESRPLKGPESPAVPAAPPPVPAQPAPAAASPPAYHPPSRTGGPLLACGCLLGSAILIAGMVLTVNLVVPAVLAALTPTATLTRTPTSTPKATSTRTRTSTPRVGEVTFDSLKNVPVGTLVILRGRLILMSSTHCSTTCGLLIQNPEDSSQVITIFVPVVKEGEEPEPNQMKHLPASYNKTDIQIRLDDGSYATVGDTILVTGKKCLTTEGDPCINEIRKIERSE